MKEEKLTSKLREKITGMENAKAYKLTGDEALQMLKEHFIDPCTSVKQLDALHIVPLFSFFKASSCTLDAWTFEHYIRPNSLLNYYYILFYDDKNVYSYGRFWLSAGPLKRKVKKLVAEKKETLSGRD